MTEHLLKEAGIHYVFHASSVAHVQKIADSGCLIAGAFIPGRQNDAGTKRDARLGGGNYVYCRMISKSGTQIGKFGKRSSLSGNLYYVMPVEKLAEYNWFISTVDLMGKLPKSVMNGEIDEPSESKERTINGIKKTFPNGRCNTANWELGIYRAIQLGDISHVIYESGSVDPESKEMVDLKQSINDMKTYEYKPFAVPENQRVKFIEACNGEVMWTKLHGMNGGL